MTCFKCGGTLKIIGGVARCTNKECGLEFSAELREMTFDEISKREDKKPTRKKSK